MTAITDPIFTPVSEPTEPTEPVEPTPEATTTVVVAETAPPPPDLPETGAGMVAGYAGAILRVAGVVAVITASRRHT